jgi:hypothetical protein
MINIKEKEQYLYIGDDIDNSFEFRVSKIHERDVIIVTGSGKETNVHKVKKEHIEEKIKKGQIKDLKEL